MKIDILSLFPEMFDGFLNTSIIKRAIDTSLVEVRIHDFREFADNKHKKVDDYPYGGGQGMVLMCQPILDCLKSLVTKDSLVILMSPQGQTLQQAYSQKLSLENISKDIHVYQFLKQIVQKDSGLFVISGATGSGKSTTLYAILDAINKMYKKNIITLEDPIEINKDYCLQIEIDDRKGISYHESLKQILRHDPDVIMVGEVRDEKTAQLALTCALTGHLVLTTIHASNCINTIKRLENLNISSLDLEDVLLGIMTQKMRFNEKKEVFILSEYIDQKNLLKYFDRKKIDYYDFSKAACTLKNVGVLNEK